MITKNPEGSVHDEQFGAEENATENMINKKIEDSQVVNEEKVKDKEDISEMESSEEKNSQTDNFVGSSSDEDNDIVLSEAIVKEESPEKEDVGEVSAELADDKSNEKEENPEKEDVEEVSADLADDKSNEKEESPEKEDVGEVSAELADDKSIVKEESPEKEDVKEVSAELADDKSNEKEENPEKEDVGEVSAELADDKSNEKEESPEKVDVGEVSAELADDKSIVKEESPEKEDVKLVSKEPVKVNAVEEDRDIIVEEPYSELDPAELEKVELPPVDYTGLSKEDLIETLSLLVDNRPPAEIKSDVERIKSLFYKKIRIEADELKQKFLDEGGKIEDYRVWVDPLDHRIKEILNKFREKKYDYNRIQEVEKSENLKKKYEIIDQIKELVNREESINKTFQEFRALQARWRSVGAVPQAALKDLWENYHHNVEIFYDYIKINNELKDIDLRKNLEAKIDLCKRAEELLDESNIINAFKKLQDYHDQWREIGPVPAESKESTWERFKEATTQINKRHHDFFDKQKEEQKKNLDIKNSYCEEVEAINKMELNNFKEFNEKAAIVMEIQKKWRKTGFTPKKQNNKIYQRFREACDEFFEKKRVFYNENREVQHVNLQKKTELCERAESVMDSTDWKATTTALIQMQKEWKEIGQTPRKQSDKCWKRFRKACDYFFNKKSEFFADIDSTYAENLNLKLALIDEINSFIPDSDSQNSFEKLQEFQHKWSEIGFVPFNKKDEVNNLYKKALNDQFDKLNIDNNDLTILKFRNRLDNLKPNPKISRKVRMERDKFYSKIKQLENDIILWENNKGFFAKSPNAEPMIKEVEANIENARKTIAALEEKVKIIDQSGLDN